jgi:hypothetical protein
MRKFVSGMMIPRTVKNPIERYALGTDSSPDIFSPMSKAYAPQSQRLEGLT